MSKKKKHNQGFSLIELLIAMTILSIVMIMVVQFMSTSSAAYRKNEKNLNLQTEAMKVIEQMSDTLMQAKYIRIETKDKGMYTITKTDASNNNVRTIAEAPSYTEVTYDFVPDNFGNYSANQSLDDADRQVIVNFDDYTLCSGKMVSGNYEVYPLGADKDAPSGTKVRSFRALKPANDYYYIKPEFVYAEYYKEVKDASTGAKSDVVVHVLYHFTDITDDRDDTCSVYVYRYETAKGTTARGYDYAKGQLGAELGGKSGVAKDDVDATQFTDDKEASNVLAAIENGANGMLTDKISDFYLSADVEGNSLLTNIMFKDLGYEYNVIETINFRNSNVLTVRPQKLFKVKGTGAAGGSGSGGTLSGGTGGGSATPSAGSSEGSSESGSGSSAETP